MHTRSSKSAAEAHGSYFYELATGFEVLEVVDGFATAQEADRAAADAERLLFLAGYDAKLFREMRNPPALDEILSDDEILAELGL